LNISETHTKLYSSSFSINYAKGCYQEQSMKNVEFQNYNKN